MMRVLIAVVVISQTAVVAASPVSIVFPSGYENMEAPGGAGTFTDYPDGYRLQFLFRASAFDALPASHTTLTGFDMRPDGPWGIVNSVTWPDFTLMLSTTQAAPGSQSNRFEANVGADALVVHQGPITLSTANIGPPGGPKEFDIAFDFQTPFHYDPAEGNLLVDWFLEGPVGWVGDDRGAATSDYSWIFAEGPDSMFATDAGVGESGIWRFRFIPDLTADFDVSGMVDGEDLTIWEHAFGQTAAADANGDGFSDGADFLAWQQEFGDAPAATVANASVIPEPTTIALLCASAALLCARKMNLAHVSMRPRTICLLALAVVVALLEQAAGRRGCRPSVVRIGRSKS